MKIDIIVKEIIKEEPVALIAITEEGDEYHAKVWGRICPCEVVDILRITVEKMEEEQEKNGLPF